MPQPIALHRKNAFSIQVGVDEVAHEIFEIVTACGDPTLTRLVRIRSVHLLIVRDVDVLNDIHHVFFGDSQTLNESQYPANIGNWIVAESP